MLRAMTRHGPRAGNRGKLDQAAKRLAQADARFQPLAGPKADSLKRLAPADSAGGYGIRASVASNEEAHCNTVSRAWEGPAKKTRQSDPF